MTKKILAMLAIVVAITTSGFANNMEDNLNKKVLSSFNRKFAQAKEISWDITNDYAKASFKINEQYLFAYFTKEGELIGVCRYLTKSQLPLKLQTAMKINYSTDWITEIFEYANEDETSYYLTVENADQAITYKSSGGDKWSVYIKVKKD